MKNTRSSYIKVIIPLFAAIIFSFFTLVRTYNSHVTWKEIVSAVLFLIVLALTGLVIYLMNKKVRF